MRFSQIHVTIFIVFCSSLSLSFVPGGISSIRPYGRNNHGIQPSTEHITEKAIKIFESPNYPFQQPSNDFDKLVKDYFPDALTNKDLVVQVVHILAEKGFTSQNTLLATSLCSDELARQLEDDFGKVFGKNFALGGLAGFPFAGNTGFKAMSSHIPDEGFALLTYGPHVGITKHGEIGKVERPGVKFADTCCGSAVAACNHVEDIARGKADLTSTVSDFTDFQQGAVKNLLLPHSNAIMNAKDKMLELPHCLYESQSLLIDQIVEKGHGGIKRGMVLLGGIQINTGPSQDDYFLPLRFDYVNPKGEVVEDMLPGLNQKFFFFADMVPLSKRFKPEVENPYFRDEDNNDDDDDTQIMEKVIKYKDGKPVVIGIQKDSVQEVEGTIPTDQNDILENSPVEKVGTEESDEKYDMIDSELPLEQNGEKEETQNMPEKAEIKKEENEVGTQDEQVNLENSDEKEEASSEVRVDTSICQEDDLEAEQTTLIGTEESISKLDEEIGTESSVEQEEVQSIEDNKVEDEEKETEDLEPEQTSSSGDEDIDTGNFDEQEQVPSIEDNKVKDDEEEEDDLESEQSTELNLPSNEDSVSNEETDDLEEEMDLEALQKEYKALERTLIDKNIELDIIQKDADEVSKAGYARKVAEYEDKRKQKMKASDNSMTTEKAHVMEKLIPILDELQSLSKSYEGSKFSENYSALSGDFSNALESMGVKESEVKEDMFAEETSVKIVSEEFCDNVEKGKIIKVLRGGFEIEDNVIRPAEVIVSLGKDEDSRSRDVEAEMQQRSLLETRLKLDEKLRLAQINQSDGKIEENEDDNVPKVDEVELKQRSILEAALRFEKISKKEKARIAAQKEEEAAKLKEEGDARIAAQKEAEAAKLKEEEKARLAADEEAARVKEQESLLRKAAREESARIAAEEHEKSSLATEDSKNLSVKENDSIASVETKDETNLKDTPMSEEEERAKAIEDELNRRLEEKEKENARIAAEEAEKARKIAEKEEAIRLKTEEEEKRRIETEKEEKEKIRIAKEERERLAAEDEAERIRAAEEEKARRLKLRERSQGKDPSETAGAGQNRRQRRVIDQTSFSQDNALQFTNPGLFEIPAMRKQAVSPTISEEEEAATDDERFDEETPNSKRFKARAPDRFGATESNSDVIKPRRPAAVSEETLEEPIFQSNDELTNDVEDIDTDDSASMNPDTEEIAIGVKNAPASEEEEEEEETDSFSDSTSDEPSTFMSRRKFYRLSLPEDASESEFIIEVREYFEKSYINIEATNFYDIIFRGADGSAIFRIENLKVPSIRNEGSVELENSIMIALYFMARPDLVSGEMMQLSSFGGVAPILASVGSALAKQQRGNHIPETLTRILFTDVRRNIAETCIENLQSAGFPGNKVDLGNMDWESRVPGSLENRFNLIVGFNNYGDAQETDAVSHAIAKSLRSSPYDAAVGRQHIRGRLVYFTRQVDDLYTLLRRNLVEGYKMKTTVEEFKLEKMDGSTLVGDSLQDIRAQVDEAKFEDAEELQFTTLFGFHDRSFNGQAVGGAFW